MNTELIFYATEEEIDNFLKDFKESDFDKIEQESITQLLFYCGNEHVQLLKPKIYGNILTEGRIARKTLEKSEGAKRCDKLFKEMKKWIEKHYFCTKMLMYREDKGETEKDAIISVLPKKCISPKAMELYEDKTIILKRHTGTPWIELIPKETNAKDLL